ncbi:hypothetical protein PanWU01x14_351500 [Parasponia andersonii]|uniref:Uncharacterized protein n=1 Tax=Parasponia andersonii TaxID=3476 RepID=A0A2P5AAL9_PARAD|nr:hypothetical protein PanWU01x14_351500 [Parasponia andersonii]
MVMAQESKFSKHCVESFLLAKTLLVWMETKKVLNWCFIHCHEVHKMVSTDQSSTSDSYELTFNRNQITCEEIKQCRFSSSIRPHNSNPGPHINTNVNIRQPEILFG